MSEFVKLLSDSEGQVRAEAASATGAIGQEAGTEEVLRELVKLLSDVEWPVRSEAARAIGAIGQVAGTAEMLRELVKLLSDSEEEVLSEAASAIAILSTQVAPEERPKALAIFRRLARAKKLERRDVGYIALRNLLAS